MKHLFIFKSNSRGMQYGIGTYITELSESLPKITDIEIYIISYNNTNYKEYSKNKKSDCITEILIPSIAFNTLKNNNFENKYASAVLRLLSDLIPENDDVIFQLNYIDDLIFAKKLKEKYNYPIISIVHFAQYQLLFEGNREKLMGLNVDRPSNNTEIILSKEKAFYQTSDCIVSVTNYMKYFLTEEYGINPDIIKVIPNGLDYSKYRSISKETRKYNRLRLGFTDEEIIILFSGRLDPCKGIFYLIEAFEKACIQNLNLRLVLVGQGCILDCQKKLQSAFGKVTFTGYLSKELLLSFYSIADIGIVLSVYDHCPYTVLEMIANKIPLIVSRVNGLNEIFTDEHCVFINPILKEGGDITFNTDEIMDAIINLAKNDSLRTEFVYKSYKKLTEMYSASRMAEDMNNLFHTITENKSFYSGYDKIK